MTRELFLSTRIVRDGEELDVCVYFKIESHSSGCPADLWGPAPHPEDPEEWEFSFDRAEIDSPTSDDAPLSEAEITGLKAWFETAAAHDKAVEAAERQKRDDRRWGDC